jgi:hypothetical protein
MNFSTALQQLIPTRAKPYCETQSWLAGAWQKWKVIIAAAFVNLVVTNGLEATMHSAPWAWLSSAFAGTGITWKAALVQAVVHAIYSGASHIAQGTRSPFPNPNQS